MPMVQGKIRVKWTALPCDRVCREYQYSARLPVVSQPSKSVGQIGLQGHVLECVRTDCQVEDHQETGDRRDGPTLCTTLPAIAQSIDCDRCQNNAQRQQQHTESARHLHVVEARHEPIEQCVRTDCHIQV